MPKMTFIMNMRIILKSNDVNTNILLYTVNTRRKYYGNQLTIRS